MLETAAMLEPETAAAAYQAATLAARHAALWIAGAHVVATLLVGGAQVGVVVYGIRVMARANEARAAVADDQRREAENRRRADEQRHAETMAAFAEQRTALAALIERTAPGPRRRV